MLLPKGACHIAKRHGNRYWRHFPKRPFALSINISRIADQVLFGFHRMLRGMGRMAGHLKRLRFNAAQGCNGKRLSQCCCGTKKTQEEPCSLHRISLRLIGLALRLAPYIDYKQARYQTLYG